MLEISHYHPVSFSSNLDELKNWSWSKLRGKCSSSPLGDATENSYHAKLNENYQWRFAYMYCPYNLSWGAIYVTCSFVFSFHILVVQNPFCELRKSSQTLLQRVIKTQNTFKIFEIIKLISLLISKAEYALFWAASNL